MANPFEEEFGTFGAKSAPSDNPFEQEFGTFGSKAAPRKTPAEPSPVVEKPKKGFLEQVGDDAGAAFQSAALEGFGGLVARKGFEWSGYGIDKLKEAYPGKSDDWYKSKQKAIINQTMLDARKEARDKQAANAMGVGNPFTKDPNDKIDPLAFAAGVAGSADPTYLVGGFLKAPVQQGFKGAAKRVATVAAEQAALGAATDAAYQGADILDGLQKDFDVGRNLLNAGFGAGFGGAAGTAREAAPFIKELFKGRTVDTTPRADPRDSNNTPITGAEPAPSFMEKAQGVLKNGNEAEIHALFDGSNIPAPWRYDIHKFVERRDADRAGGLEPVDHDLTPVSDANPQRSGVWDKTSAEAEAIRNGTPELAAPDERLPQAERQPVNEFEQEFGAREQAPQAEAAQPVADAVAADLDAARAQIAEVTKGWKNAPEYEVVNTVDEIADPNMRQYLAEQDPNGDALGLYGKDGKVRIFASRINGPDELNAILYHESLGHHGLAQKFGEKLDDTLRVLDERNVGQFKKDIDKWQAKNPDAYGGDRIRAAEEVLAEWSEKGMVKQTIADAVSKAVRDFGRKMGLKLAYSDGEIKTILNMAHQAVISGKGRNVGLNGFRVKPVEFATGDNINFDPTVKEPEGQFMKRRSDIEPKDVADEAYEYYSLGYKPGKPRSWAEAQKMAEDAGIPADMMRRARTAGNLDKLTFIYENAARDANDKLQALAVKANSPEGLTNADQEALIEALAQFDMAAGKMANHASQIGRGLNSMKAVAFSPNNIAKLAKELEAAGSELGPLTDPEVAAKFLKQYNNMMNSGNVKGARSMLNGVNAPYWWQYLLSYRQNMMLSGLSTHAKAAMDMGTSIGRELEEKTMALPLGLARQGLRALGVPVKPGFHPTEYGMHVWGLTRAALDGYTYKNAADTFVHGGHSRYGIAQDARIPIVSKVGDALAASDQFFRAFLMNSNLYALGARKAYNELKAKGSHVNWDDVHNLGSSYAQTPSQAMMKEATDLTENTMLINKSPINAAMDNMKVIRPNMTAWQQAGSFFANLVTPFIRTSSNGLMNQILRRSPLFWLDPVSMADLKAGGARADIAMSRIAFGTAILGSMWVAAGDDEKYTNAGPKNPNKLKELQASGWVANAEDEGDHYSKTSNLNMSLNPFDKHNATFTMVKGLRQAWEEGAKGDDIMRGLKLALYSAMDTVGEQTFLGDLADSTGAAAARGPTAEGIRDRYAQGMARSFIPNIAIQAANVADPNQHDFSDDPLGFIKDNIPGMAKDAPIKHNVYGQPMKTGVTPVGVRAFGMKGNNSVKTTDPTEIELNRLAKLTPAAVISPVPKTITVDGDKVKLSSAQYQDYQREAGTRIVDAVRDMMDSGEWDGLSDKDKIKATKKIQTNVRKEVRGELFPAEGDWMTSKQLKSKDATADDE